MTPDPYVSFIESVQALIAGGMSLAESLMHPVGGAKNIGIKCVLQRS